MPANRNLVIRTLLVAAVAVGGLLGLGPVRRGGGSTDAIAAPASASAEGMTVQGVGRVTLSPDLATIQLSVERTASTAAGAQSAASAAMAKVIAAVRAKGIATADIASQWLSLQPRYDSSRPGSDSPRITGYVARQALQVKVRKVDATGPVIDAAIGAGANTLEGISFSLADPTSATAQARRSAVADARTRAAALAAAAGVTLGAPTTISEISAPTPVPLAYALPDAAPAAGLAPTPVQPGTTEVDVTVSMTFAIGS
jgi:uncharacterized protein YggE